MQCNGIAQRCGACRVNPFAEKIAVHSDAGGCWATARRTKKHVKGWTLPTFKDEVMRTYADLCTLLAKGDSTRLRLVGIREPPPPPFSHTRRRTGCLQ